MNDTISTPPGMPLENRTTIDGYHVIGQIGRGGMAEVYLAMRRTPNGERELLALKKLWPEFTQDPVFVAMFVEEARLALALRHPNVIRTFELGVEEDRHYIAMEYLEGQSLRQAFDRTDRTEASVWLQVRVLSQVLSGLHYAHELRDENGAHLGFVHRDITPQNILITYDGEVKIVDF